MKKTHQLMLSILGAIALVGCDSASNNLPKNEPTLVFTPGFEIKISGKNIPIQGFDECPPNESLMTKIFGPETNAGLGCVVLSEETKAVSVQIFMPSGPLIEEWEVIREVSDSDVGRFHKRTSLKRPDGTLVVPAT